MNPHDDDDGWYYRDDSPHAISDDFDFDLGSVDPDFRDDDELEDDPDDPRPVDGDWEDDEDDDADDDF